MMKRILIQAISLLIAFNSSAGTNINNLDFVTENMANHNDNEGENNDETYVPLISENKVWKYVFSGGIPNTSPENGGIRINIESRFEGKIEFDGVQYDVLRTIDTTTPENCQKIKFPDYYLREEEGKVYEYIPENTAYSDSPLELLQGEYLLYDFTLKEGENVDLIGGVFDEAEMLPYTFFQQWNAEVLDIESVDILGQSCKKYHVIDTSGLKNLVSDKGSEFAYLEGVGTIAYNDGLPKYDAGDFLAFFNFNFYNVTDNGKTRFGFYLIGVYDNDGNIIYKGNAEPVAGVEQLSDINNNHSLEFYNLQGQRIDKPEPGQLYIERNGSQTRKVLWQ